jgi:hypothetical protein
VLLEKSVAQVFTCFAENLNIWLFHYTKFVYIRPDPT